MLLVLLAASAAVERATCIQVGDGQTVRMCEELESGYNQSGNYEMIGVTVEQFNSFDFTRVDGVSDLILATGDELASPLSLAKFQPKSGRVNLTLRGKYSTGPDGFTYVPVNIDWDSLRSKVNVLYLLCGGTTAPLPVLDFQGISFGASWKGSFASDFDMSKIPYVDIELTDAESHLNSQLKGKRLQTAVLHGSAEILAVGENTVYMGYEQNTPYDPVQAEHLFLNLYSDVLQLHGSWPTSKLTINAPLLMRLDVTTMTGTGAIVVYTEAVVTEQSQSFSLRLPDTPVNVVVSSPNLPVTITGGGPTLTFTEPFTVSGVLTFPETATSVTIEDITMTAGSSIVWNAKKANTLADGLTIKAVSIAGVGCSITGASVELINVNLESSVSLLGATTVQRVAFDCDVKSSRTGFVLVSATQASSAAPKAEILVTEPPSTMDPLILFVLNDQGSFSPGWGDVLEDDEHFSSYIATTPEGNSAVLAKREDKKKGLGPGAIAGIVIGCLAAVAIIGVVAFLCARKRKKDASTSSEGQVEDTASDKESAANA